MVRASSENERGQVMKVCKEAKGLEKKKEGKTAEDMEHEISRILEEKEH